MSSTTERVPHSIVVTLAAIMSISAVTYTILHRSELRRMRRRSFSTSATPPASLCRTCISPRPESVDPVVEQENCIERTLPHELKELHAQAVAEGKTTYIDPKTGFSVFTRLGQMNNKRCCGCRCRHCPYGHINVKANCCASTTTPVVPAAATLTTAPATAPATTPAAEAAAKTVAPKHSVVYTKTGDKGTSALFTGERRKKTDAVFEALGELDELSSHVGLARAMLRGAPDHRAHDGGMMTMLEDIQQELLNAGTVVATPTGSNAADETAQRMTDILEGYRFPAKTAEVEKAVDVMDSRLVPLRIFILPGGGNTASAQLHVCRTVCRRAERRMIEVRELYGGDYSDHLRQATVYVNRLSDFFFVAARSVAEEDIVRKYD